MGGRPRRLTSGRAKLVAGQGAYDFLGGRGHGRERQPGGAACACQNNQHQQVFHEGAEGASGISLIMGTMTMSAHAPMNSIGTAKRYCYFRHMETAAKPLKNIVLVGMMGAGKSSIGRRLAALLGCGFADNDHEIEMAARKSIPEIFASSGEAAFRQMEHESLLRLFNDPIRLVIAAGGGAFVQPRNLDLIARKGVSVWLKADPETLLQRLAGDTSRPLLQGEDPRTRLASLLAEREPVYAKADITVDVSKGDLETVTARVATAVKQYMEQAA